MNMEDMTLEQLERECEVAFGRYMYYECAERGYDFDASKAARARYYLVKDELERRASASG